MVTTSDTSVKLGATKVLKLESSAELLASDKMDLPDDANLKLALVFFRCRCSWRGDLQHARGHAPMHAPMHSLHVGRPPACRDAARTPLTERYLELDTLWDKCSFDMKAEVKFVQPDGTPLPKKTSHSHRPLPGGQGTRHAPPRNLHLSPDPLWGPLGALQIPPGNGEVRGGARRGVGLELLSCPLWEWGGPGRGSKGSRAGGEAELQALGHCR